MASSVYSTLTYWLVHHPYIANFTWKEGETFGSTVFFVSVVVFVFLCATFLLWYAMDSLPSLSPRILKLIRLVHTFVLCLLFMIMAVGCTLSITSSQDPKAHLICFPVDVKPSGPVFFWAQVYYLSKILQFVDILVMIVSKSVHLLSFYYVYHHGTAVVMAYLWLHTRQSMFPAGIVINSMVYVILYGYYFLRAVGLRPKWKMFVKSYLILGYLAIFTVGFGWMVQHYFGSGCSGIWGVYFNGAFVSSLVGLFVYKNYVKKEMIKLCLGLFPKRND
ncbi:unnamed protein product [Eruca vesicaria subsp. sativa]|uniref:very-long-chain 3-oxoacyl-CoA synthase n=1 Tax=Eruca vesicaria subsp. sativa TaxID=29727 RepID=A0ABC8LEE2_ERUVS|nr:unnamed protein product [Eruca vesicaria subsp. sativa]